MKKKIYKQAIDSIIKYPHENFFICNYLKHDNKYYEEFYLFRELENISTWIAIQMHEEFYEIFYKTKRL